MTARAATALFIDTGAFIAWFDDTDTHHERAKAVFRAIRAGDLPYRPLYTSRSVLSELATRLQRARNVGHAGAVDALTTICKSNTFNVESLDDAGFADACDEFARYDDQRISFVDQTTAVLARERDIKRVFAFDSDFRTLGFTVVPEDTGEP
jgi:predicted nucleic acid-binding protein